MGLDLLTLYIAIHVDYQRHISSMLLLSLTPWFGLEHEMMGTRGRMARSHVHILTLEERDYSCRPSPFDAPQPYHTLALSL